MEQIIDGKLFAEHIVQKTKEGIKSYLDQGHRAPKLSVILVGDHPASKVYVNKKKKQCERVAIDSEIIQLTETVSLEELLETINKLNQDDDVDGILVQLPLPKHIIANKVLESISPNKDVDGFHPINIGRLVQRNPFLRPCTPYGIIKLLQYLNIKLEGMNAVVVGASNIVGRPMLLELLLVGVTVTICNSHTQNLPDKIANADLVIVGVGKPEMIKGQWLKKGCIAIDVGINRLSNGKLIGDIEFNEALKKVKFITPVPGGIGPITVAQLMDNTFIAYKNNLKG